MNQRRTPRQDRKALRVMKKLVDSPTGPAWIDRGIAQLQAYANHPSNRGERA